MKKVWAKYSYRTSEAALLAWIQIKNWRTGYFSSVTGGKYVYELLYCSFFLDHETFKKIIFYNSTILFSGCFSRKKKKQKRRTEGENNTSKKSNRKEIG